MLSFFENIKSTLKEKTDIWVNCDAKKKNSSAAAPVTEDSCSFGSNKYFMLCGIGGILSCGTTHTLVVPLDLVKCRLQVDQAKYKNLFHGFKVTYAEEGPKGLVKGWAPTFLGYSAQVIIYYKKKYA